MDKAYQVCLEMLRQRDYIVTKENDDHILATKPNGEPMATFFSDIPKFNVKAIQMYIKAMNDMDLTHSIIVYKEGVTSFTRKAIAKSIDLKFELFAEKDLQYNITQHRLQPIFEKLESKEAKDFVKTYGIKFGVMRVDDPIARFYGYERGSVIRITRENQNKFITYRIVK